MEMTQMKNDIIDQSHYYRLFQILWKNIFKYTQTKTITYSMCNR